MSFWNKFKFKKKPFKEPLEEKKEELEIKKKIETSKIAPKKEEKKDKQITKSVKTEKLKEEKKGKKKEVKKVRSKRKEDTGDAYRILIRPIISEKVTRLGEINQYVFEIASFASKNEVKKAIEKVYGVVPLKIRVIKKIGKKVRFGRNFGKLKDKKKAIITLKKGEKIQIYEGV